MYGNQVEICGVNTGALPVLTEREKTELLLRIKMGDRAARQKMINGNLRLVLSVVQKFTGRGENPDDLFQVGCIGLIKAIDHFDPTLGVRFSTYGVPMIIGEIRRFLRDNNPLRVSRSVRDVASRAMRAKEQLQKKLGQEPNPLIYETLLKRYKLRREETIFIDDSAVNVKAAYDLGINSIQFQGVESLVQTLADNGINMRFGPQKEA